MAEKKTFYKLDEIGFVGTQEKSSAIHKKADAKKTTEIIKKRKLGKVFSIPHPTLTKAAK